jgi:hypothetical protein
VARSFPPTTVDVGEKDRYGSCLGLVHFKVVGRGVGRPAEPSVLKSEEINLFE